MKARQLVRAVCAALCLLLLCAFDKCTGGEAPTSPELAAAPKAVEDMELKKTKAKINLNADTAQDCKRSIGIKGKFPTGITQFDPYATGAGMQVSVSDENGFGASGGAEATYMETNKRGTRASKKFRKNMLAASRCPGDKKPPIYALVLEMLKGDNLYFVLKLKPNCKGTYPDSDWSQHFNMLKNAYGDGEATLRGNGTVTMNVNGLHASRAMAVASHASSGPWQLQAHNGKLAFSIPKE